MTERWVNSVCDRCYVACGIKVHVVDEVVVGVEGDPENPLNRGKMCAKGKAGVIAHYNPKRVTTPLKRTNPQKGIGVNPQWQEISYDQAISTIADCLRLIQDEPQKLHTYTWGYDCELKTIATAFGTVHNQYAGAHECGKSIHVIEHMAAGGFHQQTDLHYCNYCLFVGTQGGIAARSSYTHLARDMADARARGMRLVAVDPVGGYAAAKADEWVPIRPGTDAAFGLALINVLLNDLGIYDSVFIKQGTNGPYLVGDDGCYVRDAASGKPLVYDPVEKWARTYDDASFKDKTLEGNFEVQGKPCRPAFELLKEHVRVYTPEFASRITTIPAATIERLAREFGQAVQIGSTISLEGKQFPFRPAALDWARGPQGHKHGFHHSWALKLVNILMGNVNVPGGILSTGAMGQNPYEWGPQGGIDGMLVHAGLGGIGVMQLASSFPGRKPVPPERMDLLELFPLAPHGTVLFPVAGAEPEKFGLDYKIEVAMHSPSNLILTCYGDLKLADKFYGSIPFVMGYAFELNETDEAYDDIVLPMPSYLERQDAGASSFGGIFGPLSPVGQDDWYYQLRQKAVEPPEGMMHPTEVAREIFDRLGRLPEFNKTLNRTLRYREPHFLESDKKHELDEIQDRLIKSVFGSDRSLDWAKEHGVIRYHRSAEEAYPGPYMAAHDMRLPIYLEHFYPKGRELKEVVESLGLEWDFSDYKALPDWLPCDAFETRGKDGFDFVAVHYKLPFIYGAFCNDNPWINEICERTPYTYPVLVNEDAAREHGIGDGDEIWLETPVHKARAIAKLTQCIHPEVVAIGGHFGHWAKGMPIANGKGVAYNPLLPHDLEHIDKLSGALDNCALVRITKVD